MKELNILGDNRFETYAKTRAGCRAVIVSGKNILLSHEIISKLWMLPGGGMEDGETPEACVIRETEEETGLIVRPLRQFLIMNEYYEEYRYVSHYFLCERVGTGQLHLTDAETRRGLQPEWLPLDEALDIFSHHADYAAQNEEKRGIYLREYLALKAYQEFAQQI